MIRDESIKINGSTVPLAVLYNQYKYECYSKGYTTWLSYDDFVKNITNMQLKK